MNLTPSERSILSQARRIKAEKAKALRAVKKAVRVIEKGEWPGYPDDGEAASFTSFLTNRLQAEAETGDLPELEY